MDRTDMDAPARTEKKYLYMKISYVLSLVLAALFAVFVNLLMKRQIGKIQMAESLKAVE